MSFELDMIEEPKVTSAVGSASYWLMSENPMIWKFQRKDLIILSITNLGGGEVRLKFTSTPFFTNVGDYVYYGNTIDFQTGEYLVTAVDVANRTMDIQASFPLGNLGWINDTTNLQNYHAEISIYEWNTSGTQGDPIATAKFYDSPSGLITADLREYLRPYLIMSMPSFFGVGSKHDLMSKDFSFTWKPAFLNPNFSTANSWDYNTRNWSVKATAQLGDEFGQNLRRYVTYEPESTLNEDNVMHFNSMFDEPYYFDGYPFALSFIYGENFDTNYLQRHIQFLDINSSNTGSEITTIFPAVDRPAPHVVTIRGRGSAIPSDAEYFYLWFEDSETAISSDGGGNGGGSSSGGGESDIGVLSGDIVAVGTVFGPTT